MINLYSSKNIYILSWCNYFHIRSIKSIYFTLGIHTKWPNKTHQTPKQKQPIIIFRILIHIIAYSRLKPRQHKTLGIILMNIPSMSVSKLNPKWLKSIPAILIPKSIINLVMYKYYFSRGSNLIRMTTVIDTLSWLQGLSSYMGDNFSFYCVILPACSAITVLNCSIMMLYYIMEALSMETKISLYAFYFLILLIKIRAMLDIFQIGYHRISTQCQHQIKHI